MPPLNIISNVHSVFANCKRVVIYKEVPVNMKTSIFNIFAISAWIAVQQKRVESL